MQDVRVASTVFVVFIVVNNMILKFGGFYNLFYERLFNLTREIQDFISLINGIIMMNSSF